MSVLTSPCCNGHCSDSGSFSNRPSNLRPRFVIGRASLLARYLFTTLSRDLVMVIVSTRLPLQLQSSHPRCGWLCLIVDCYVVNRHRCAPVRIVWASGSSTVSSCLNPCWHRCTTPFSNQANAINYAPGYHYIAGLHHVCLVPAFRNRSCSRLFTFLLFPAFSFRFAFPLC